VTTADVIVNVTATFVLAVAALTAVNLYAGDRFARAFTDALAVVGTFAFVVACLAIGVWVWVSV
jgi:hypothetical protein